MWTFIPGWSILYRMSQEECEILRESVPYVELYWYNSKHLYPKLNGYGDNGQRSLKLWQLLHTYWWPNTYWNWQGYVVSVMLISVLNIKVTCEWHKAIKLNYKNTRYTAAGVLEFQALCILSVMKCYLIALGEACSPWLANVRVSRSHVSTGRCGYKVNGLTTVEVQYAEMQDVHTFLWPLSP